jgi:hypothetical protein
MNEAQSAFDGAAMPLCPAELASPVLHRVLSYAMASQQAVCEALEAELGVHCMPFTVPSGS